MSLLNNISTEENKPYNFVSSGISGFMDEYQQPKQEQNIREDVFDAFPTEPEEIHDEQPDGLPERLQASASVAKASAKILTTALDSTLSGVFGFIAKGDSTDFRADDAQRDDLETAFAEYIKLKGGDIPPGVALLILVISIYGGKGALAFQLRKANTEKELLTQRAVAAERETERLREKLKEFENKTT